MDSRIPYTLGSVVTLTGAFMVGWVLHQVFVKNVLDPTAPGAVLVALGGLVVIAAGRRLERGFDPSEFVIGSEPDEDDEEAFDEEFSPVDEEMLAGRERDDPDQPDQ